MRASARTMIAVAATAGVLAGCAKSPAGSATGGPPPKLHLAGDAQTAAGGAAAAPMPAAINGAATNGSGPSIDPGFNGFGGFGGYVLTGTLPTSPTHAPVWRWATIPASKDEIVKLGALVGVTGTPQRHPHGWLLNSAAGEVRVSDHGGHQWSFSRADTLACSPFSVDIDNADDATSGSGCAVAVSVAPQVATGSGVAPQVATGSGVAPQVATGSGVLPQVAAGSGGGTPTPETPPIAPTPPSDGPDSAHARAAAAALLSGLNITGSEQVDVGAPTSTVTLTQSVGGLVTQGLETSITVDGTGVEAATGRLEQPTKGDDYPLRTAKDAFADLNNRPRMMLMPYCGPVPIGAPAGPTGGPTGPMPLGAPAGPGGKFPLNSAGPGVSPAPGLAPSPGLAPGGVNSPPAEPSAVDSLPATTAVPAPTPIEPVPSCPTPKPTPVTGASLGLQLTYDGSGAGAEILVPSWLFTLDGSTSPIAEIAIDPAYLAGPAESPGAGATAVEPNSAPPAPAATPPAGKGMASGLASPTK